MPPQQRKLHAAHKRHPSDQYLGPEIPAAEKLEGHNRLYTSFGKESGDNTNHGDANRMLLEWLALTHEHPFNIELYVNNHLANKFKSDDDLLSNADLHAKAMVGRLGTGGTFTLAGETSKDEQIVRCAGAFAVYKELAEIKQVCSLATQFTHSSDKSLKASIFWSEVVWRVIYHQEHPEDAIMQVISYPFGGAWGWSGQRERG